MKRLSGIVLCCAALISVAAEVVFDGGKAAVWSSKYFKDGEGGIVANLSYPIVQSKDFITVESGKTYVVEGEFRLITPKEKLPQLYFGFMPYTADGKVINYTSIGIVSTKLMTVVKDVKAGDTKMVVNEFPFPKPTRYGRFVFGAKADKSDLPNFNFSPAADWSKNKINADGSVEITFQKPVTQAVAAGTVVRLHTAGNTFVYAGIKRIGKEWVTCRQEYKSFYPGTAKIKLAMNLPAPGCKVEMRNVKVTVK